MFVNGKRTCKVLTANFLFMLRTESFLELNGVNSMVDGFRESCKSKGTLERRQLLNYMLTERLRNSVYFAVKEEITDEVNPGVTR